MSGLAYLCIFNIFVESGKVAEDSLASLEREISNHFYVVKDILKNDSTLKKYFGYLLDDILSKYYEFGINCLVRMANSFAAQHAEAKTKGFIGTQLAYLNEAVLLYKQMDRESFADKKNLQKRFEPLKKQYDDTKLMNDQVFKAPIPAREKLTDIKPIEQKVRPLEPKNIRVPPQEAAYFSSFLSEEMESVRSSLKLFVSNKKQHIEKTLFDLKERLTEINKNYNVPFLKSCASLDGSLNEDAQKKIEHIKEQGEKAIIELMQKVAKERQTIESTIAAVDKIIFTETEKDRQAMASLQGGNYTPFVQTEAESLNTLNDSKNYFRNYRAVEEKCSQEYDLFKAYLPKIINSKGNLQELASNPEVNAFVEANKETLATLKKFADGVDMLINQHLKNDMQGMLQILTEIDIEGSCQKVLMNETDIQTIFKDIDEKLGPMAQSFEDKVTKVQTPLDKVKDLASKLQTSMPKGAGNGINELLMAIDFFFVVFI